MEGLLKKVNYSIIADRLRKRIATYAELSLSCNDIRLTRHYAFCIRRAQIDLDKLNQWIGASV